MFLCEDDYIPVDEKFYEPFFNKFVDNLPHELKELHLGCNFNRPINKLEDSFKILLKLYEKEEFKNLRIIDLRQNNQIILNG